MSACPDWGRIEKAGEDFLREESPLRRQALEHAAGCEECARRARRLDPTLAVAELPAPPASRAEIDAVKHAVLGLAHLREVEAAVEPRRSAGARARMAAVAVFTAGILLVAENVNDRGSEESAAAPVAAPVSLLSEDYRLYGSLPLVESLDPSEARVYQLGGDDFSLVWIVDESIEVAPPDL